jgi:hypothetical protein
VQVAQAEKAVRAGPSLLYKKKTGEWRSASSKNARSEAVVCRWLAVAADQQDRSEQSSARARGPDVKQSFYR